MHERYQNHRRTALEVSSAGHEVDSRRTLRSSGLSNRYIISANKVMPISSTVEQLSRALCLPIGAFVRRDAW